MPTRYIYAKGGNPARPTHKKKWIMNWDNFSKIGQGLGGIGSVASTVAGIIGSIGQQKRQKDLMDYQHEKNLELYDKQFSDQMRYYHQQLADQRQLIQEERDYNDYSSQADRARAAGINPLAIFGNGGTGIQSASGSTPSSSVPSAGSSSIPGADNMGANLISAGSTIANITRQNALLDAERRAMEAEAQIKETDAKWADKNYAQDYESKEIHKQMQTIDLGTATQRARYTTAVAEMAELNVEEFKELKPERILSYKTSLGLSIEQLSQMKVNGEYQRDFITTELDKRNAEISAIRTGEVVAMMDANTNRKNANINEYNAETARKQYGLSQREFDALNEYRSEIIRLHDEDQELQERFRKQQDKHHKQNLTRDYILGIGNILERRAEIKAQIKEKEQSAKTRFGESVVTALIFKGLP